MTLQKDRNWETIKKTLSMPRRSILKSFPLCTIKKTSNVHKKSVKSRTLLLDFILRRRRRSRVYKTDFLNVLFYFSPEM